MARRFRWFLPLVVIALVMAACGTSTPSGADPKTVTVIGTWTDAEQDAFLAMVKPWETDTGNKVKYQGTRSINDILAAGIPTGVLPDLAGLPGPGQMAEYAKAGALQPLDEVLDIGTYTDETSPALVDLGKSDGKTYGIFIKAALKGLIYYNTASHDYSASPPATWDELISQGQANMGDADSLWCVGIESGDASGWPATDWIENILLRQSGPEVYNDWWAGKVKWTDPKIKAAFDLYMDVVKNTYGGGTNAVATKFELAGDPLFKSPPGCEFFEQANFMSGLGKFADLKAGTDFNAFPFPAINPDYTKAVEGAGDLFGMFHATDAAKSLMKYLVTAKAQDIWVKAGGALSANKNATSYPDDFSKNAGAAVANAEQFVFDASDLMPSAMNAAFWSHLVSLTSGSETVDEALKALQTVADDAYKPAA
ncbi:MAG: extracellular solute-binding protein [Chloroflexi bacterium]|nr:extracellular solute-binding protein [Chloroflexota bacterium]